MIHDAYVTSAMQIDGGAREISRPMAVVASRRQAMAPYGRACRDVALVAHGGMAWQRNSVWGAWVVLH